MRTTQLIVAGVLVTLGLLLALFTVQMAFNCIYIDEGESLLLRYKGPLLLGSGKAAEPGQFAKAGEVGIMEELKGPGRHFYCPIWWERKRIPDVVVLRRPRSHAHG